LWRKATSVLRDETHNDFLILRNPPLAAHFDVFLLALRSASPPDLYRNRSVLRFGGIVSRSIIIGSSLTGWWGLASKQSIPVKFFIASSPPVRNMPLFHTVLTQLLNYIIYVKTQNPKE
jgi:hypothetical protein